MDLQEFMRTNWPDFITVIIIFLTIITLFHILGINLNPIEDNQVDKIVIIETFNTKPSAEVIPSTHNNNPSAIHDTCVDFSNQSCGNASYCVLLNGEQCVGGNIHGPTFLTKNGKNVDFDYFIHKGKCRGECPAIS